MKNISKNKILGLCLIFLAACLMFGMGQFSWSNPEFESFAPRESLRLHKRSIDIVANNNETIEEQSELSQTNEPTSLQRDGQFEFASYPFATETKTPTARPPSTNSMPIQSMLQQSANGKLQTLPSSISTSKPVGYNKVTRFEQEQVDRAEAVKRAFQSQSKSSFAGGRKNRIVNELYFRADSEQPNATSIAKMQTVRSSTTANANGSSVSQILSSQPDGPSNQRAIKVVSSQSELAGGGDYDVTAANLFSESGFSIVERIDEPKNHAPRVARLVEPGAGSYFEPATIQGGPTAAQNVGDFLLASQPELGAHFKDDRPLTGRGANLVPTENADFAPDPIDPYMPYDPGRQKYIYQGKTLNANQRPLIELGRPWYQLGQLPESSTILGAHNPVSPQFLIFGDFRVAYANNVQNGDSVSQLATELNLFWHLQLTGTDRFVAFVSPLDNGAKNTSFFLDEDVFDEEFDFDFDFGYYEGDIGALVGGFIGETLPFDLPVALGVMPLLVQNGVWMEDAFLGVAATIPARNSAKLDISNADFTFFAGFDEIISDAFEGEDDAAKMWGMLSFIEAWNGYLEFDYAYLEDRTARDRSYHNIGIGFTRRYGRFLSNSTRAIINAGQSTEFGDNTADGVLLLSENSLITGVPASVIPYFNFWAGFDRPQSAARAGAAGGVLRNTGILFESDGMTGFPTLDATAQDTFGGAIGVNIMPNDWSQQLILEMAALGVMGNPIGRNANDNQYGLGFRYQLPLTNATIFRADGMYGSLDSEDDIHGIRMELRRKF